MAPRPQHRWLLIGNVLTIFCLGASMLAPPSRAATPTSEQRFLEGLLNRRLFALAEMHCRQRLSDERLTPRGQAEAAADLARALTEQALNAAPDEREALWRNANDALQPWRETIRDPSLQLLVQRQEALVHLARGRQLRQEAEVVAQPEAWLDQAKDALRRAASLLEDASREAASLQIERHRGATPDFEQGLSQGELLALEHDLRRQMAEALENQALCYPADSLDRVNSLSRAAEQYQALAERPDPVDWTSRLRLARVVRLLGKLDDAERLLNALTQQLREQEAAAEFAEETALELARLDLDRGRIDAALQRLTADEAASRSAAWDYERLNALLLAWQEADGPQAAERQQQAVAQVQAIEARHAPYWRRRAESLLGSMVARQGGAEDLEVLTRAAQSFYRAGKPDDALTAYDRARQAALDARRPEQAFELGYTAAAIEHQRQRHAAALTRFRQTALESPQHERAAAAHALAIVNAAQLLRDAPVDEAATSDADSPARRYEALLREHLERWPEADSVGKVALWLGRWLQQGQAWNDAIDAYRSIAADSAQYAEAQQRIEESYQELLADLQARGEPIEPIAVQAADYFERVVTGGTRLPERFTAVDRHAAVASAHFRVAHTSANHDRAERLLRYALAGSPDADAAWKGSAQTWLVYALALQPGQAAEAEKTLRELAAASPAELLKLLDGLSGAAQQAGPAAAAALAQLQLNVIERLTAAETPLDAADQAKLARIRAAALAARGSDAEALAEYRALSAQHPNNGEIQTAYARLLLQSDARADWQTGLVQWREVEKRTRPNTPGWYEAKLAQATAYEKLGNCTQAVRIVQFTRLLHKDLGGPEMRRQFEQLLSRCQSP